jgi:hypothetical protein
MAASLNPCSSAIAGDCKTIIFTATGADGTATIYVTAPDASSTTITAVIAGGTVDVTFNTGILDYQYGVYKFELTDANGDTASLAILAACDIDCCLVLKTNELLDCDCDCEKCSALLAQTQKIFLLLKSAKYALVQFNSRVGGYNNAYITNAKDLYEKAKALCDDTCGCDC